MWAEGEDEGEDEGEEGGEDVAKVHPAPRRTSKTEGSMDVLRCGGDYGRTGKEEEGWGERGGEEREGKDGRG